MLVNVHHGTPAEHRRLLVAGVAFLTGIALLIWLSIAIYNKSFESTTMVTIKAERAGLQLSKFGDVRINGVLVGQVREVEQDGKEASIKVGLKPEAAKEIPANVTVEILPTTLFGQKYVSFVRPKHPEGSLEDGDVIASDRVDTNVELSRILADLFPLLRSIKPEDLNYTLNALATALGGRGEQLGESLDKLESYLGSIDDQLPKLRENLILFADVADTYDAAAPDLLRILRNVTVTSKTLIDNEDQLGVFFEDLAGLADTSTRILQDNEQNLIRAGELTAPVLELLATYSPEFPCLLRGLDRYYEPLSEIFEGDRVKQYIELTPKQYEPYKEEDRPVYGEVGRGPWCAGLPYPPVPIGPYNDRDGNNNSIDQRSPFTLISPIASRTSMGYAGTPGDQEILSAMLAGESGRPADSYGAMSSLLYGPLVRGEEVRG